MQLLGKSFCSSHKNFNESKKAFLLPRCLKLFTISVIIIYYVFFLITISFFMDCYNIFKSLFILIIYLIFDFKTLKLPCCLFLFSITVTKDFKLCGKNMCFVLGSRNFVRTNIELK